MGQIIGLSALNVGLAIFFSPFLEGIIRKLVAFVQSRIGPPIIQPYYDLLKLLGKEEIQSSENFLFRFSPVLSFGVILLTAMLTPIGTKPPLGFAGDIIVFVYLIALSGVLIVTSGVTSENPYGILGSAREMMLMLTVEPVLAIALITMGVKCGSMRFADMTAWTLNEGYSISMIIVGVALFLSIIAQLAKLPFDIVEADQEIIGGPFIEQSGPRLALFKWGYFAKELIFASVFLSVFIPWPSISFVPLSIIVHLLKVCVFIAIVAIVHVVNPRIRIDQAVRYFGLLIFVAFIGLAFALVGA